MEPLTEKQQESVDFIKKFIKKNGYPPTIKEIAKKLNVANNTIQCRVVQIEKKGYITKKKGLARSIRIVV